MFSPLKLYYLNQMGIKPWIKRDNEIKLIIFIGANLTPKESSLFQNLLTFLELPSEEYKIIKVETSKLIPSVGKNPLLRYLSIGITIDNFAFHYQIPELKVLLANPRAKKEIYSGLHTLKAEICNHA